MISVRSSSASRFPLQVRPLARERRRKLYATSLAMCGRLGGRSALPFSKEEISLIAGASRGISRLVNSICDSALSFAHAVGNSWITVDQVRQVLRDLDLTDSREEQCDSEKEARPKTLTNLETLRHPIPVRQL